MSGFRPYTYIWLGDMMIYTPSGVLAFRHFCLRCISQLLPSNTEAGTCNGADTLLISVRVRML